MTALTEIGTQVRRQRATAKTVLRNAPDRRQAWAFAADYIEARIPALEGMAVSSLLFACNWTGSDAVRQVLRHVGCSELRRVEHLTERQRDVLLGVLRGGGLGKGAR